jgi:hypothetical protein
MIGIHYADNTKDIIETYENNNLIDDITGAKYQRIVKTCKYCNKQYYNYFNITTPFNIREDHKNWK